MRPDVRWSPREANRAADRLANGDSSGFSPAFRLRLLPPVGGWFILDEALVLGGTAENEKKKYQAEEGAGQGQAEEARAQASLEGPVVS